MEMSGFEVYIKNRPKLVKGPKFVSYADVRNFRIFIFLSSLILSFVLKCHKANAFIRILFILIIHRCVYPCIVF